MIAGRYLSYRAGYCRGRLRLPFNVLECRPDHTQALTHVADESMLTHLVMFLIHAMNELLKLD
jgi:hypothetical protein